MSFSSDSARDLQICVFVQLDLAQVIDSQPDASPGNLQLSCDILPSLGWTDADPDQRSTTPDT